MVTWWRMRSQVQQPGQLTKAKATVHAEVITAQRECNVQQIPSRCSISTAQLLHMCVVQHVTQQKHPINPAPSTG